MAMKLPLSLIASLVFLLVFRGALSETFVVSNTYDYTRLTVEGSLRWAVAQANTNTGRDTITFHPNMAHLDSIIALSNGLQITGELVIKGTRIGDIKIDCQNEVRGFWVIPSEGGKYEFSGLTIRRAVSLNSNYPNGGAIYFDNPNRIASSLLVKKCVFYSCEATNGGAIAYTGTVINIDSCHFLNNTSSNNGGALDVDISRGELLINNCHFGGNNISSQSEGQGGAVNIFQDDSQISIENSSFLWNSGRARGGAISYGSELEDPLTIVNCSFIGNSASTYDLQTGISYGTASAIYSSGNLALFHTTFSQNYAADGFAIIGRNIKTQNSIYYNNYSSQHGGYRDLAVLRGNIQSLGGNLVQDTTGWAPYYTPVASDLLNYGNDENEYIPLLYPVTNFESFTYYMPPIENTVVIGGAVSYDFSSDQLGNKRGKPADIGAIEGSYYTPPRAYAGEDDTIYTDRYVLQAAEEPQADGGYWEFIGQENQDKEIINRESPNAIITGLEPSNTYGLIWRVYFSNESSISDTVQITVLNSIPEITTKKIVIKRTNIEEELDLKTVVNPYKAIDSLWIKGPFAVLDESDIAYEVDYENFILKLTVLNDSIKEFQDSLLLGVCNGFRNCDSAYFSVVREGVLPVSGVKDIKVFNFISPNGDCKNEVFDFQIQTSANELLSFVDPNNPCGLSESSEYDNLFSRIKNIEVIIFNRWGDQVALIDSYYKPITNVWKPAELPDGTYYYKIVLDLGNSEFKKSGFLELR